jgi:hypothetical protein
MTWHILTRARSRRLWVVCSSAVAAGGRSSLRPSLGAFAARGPRRRAQRGALAAARLAMAAPPPVAESDDDDGEPRLPQGRPYPLPPPRAPPPSLTYNGMAVHTYADGSVYAGDWVRGMRSGWGVFTTPDGCRYSGEWLTDKHDGLGVAKYPSGNRYEGEFRRNTRHGRGLFLWKTSVRKRRRVKQVSSKRACRNARDPGRLARAECCARAAAPAER